MKWLNIIGAVVGLLVTLPTIGTMIYTVVTYSDTLIDIAEICSGDGVDCIQDYKDLHKRVDELENR